MHVALLKCPIHQFEPVNQSRQQEIRAYCPNIYTVNKGFAIDWCAFRLLVLDQKISSEDTTAIYKELGRFFTTEDPTGLAIKTLNFKICS